MHLVFTFKHLVYFCYGFKKQTSLEKLMKAFNLVFSASLAGKSYGG